MLNCLGSLADIQARLQDKQLDQGSLHIQGTQASCQLGRQHSQFCTSAGCPFLL